MRNTVVAILLSFGAGGCGAKASPSPTPTIPSQAESVPQSLPSNALDESRSTTAHTAPLKSPLPTLGPRYGWCVNMDTADHVVVARLTIPGVFTDKAVEIPIQRYMRIDAEGMLQPEPAGSALFVSSYADGHNEKGGFGYGGGIDLNDDVDDDKAGDDNSIVLHVHYYWTTPDQVRGQVDETVPVKLGIPADVKLKSGCRLRVDWQPPKPS